MTDMSVLIVSADKNEDLWSPFFLLYKKYWKHDYKTFIVTETKDCEYFETIKTQGSWTSRVREALKQLDSKYVFLMLDDFFLHKRVDNSIVEQVLSSYKSNTACYNFEMKYNTPNKEMFFKRQNREPYLNSCQPSIHDRLKLIERLQKDQTPWEFELTTVDSPYDFYINTKELVFDIGYYEEKKPWCLVQGKWANEAIELFKKEKIEFDFKKRGLYEIDLSIIIPYYKTLELTKKLLDNLIPQLTDKCEVILVDDGCYEKELDNYDIRIFHKKNGGVSSARNYGLNRANGKYIAFIDSDDMISKDYIKKILNKTKEEWDYCYISWKSQTDTVIIANRPPTWNECIWNCVFKSSLIGKRRFNEQLQYGEDMDFAFRVKSGIRANITDILYYYNAGRKNSITDNYCTGKLEKYKPLKAQLVLYLKAVSKIGGVETFLYEFFREFYNKYDILFLYEDCDPLQLQRYKQLVRCVKYYNQKVECDTYLNVNHTKNIADNITATSGRYYDMCHTDYSAMGWKYTTHPKTTLTIPVSNVVKKALLAQFKKLNIKVVRNLLHDRNNIRTTKPNKVLKLISATRLSWEKGYDRIKILAKRLNELKKPFIWEIYTADCPNEEIPNFIFKKPILNVVDYIKKADYLVQLSNTEADGYSTKEAFNYGIPVIATNYPSIYEQGIEIGKNGYVLEMDMSNMDEVITNMYKNYPIFEPMNFNFEKNWISLFPEQMTSNYEYDEREVVDDIEDKWVALQRMKDDEKNIIFAGQEPILKSSERIRWLLDWNIIERKEVI